MLQKIFNRACQTGDLEEAQRLYHISVETDPIEKKDDNVHAHSMDNERKTYTSTNKCANVHAHKLNIHAENECAFRRACWYGHLDVAQWLYDVSFASKDTINIHADNESAFRWACSNGHLAVVQWLYQLSVTTDKLINIHADNDSAFCLACIHGHLDVAQWFYDLSVGSNPIVDISVKIVHAFRFACCDGHLDVAQWLYDLSVKINENVNEYTKSNVGTHKLVNKLNIHAFNEGAFRGACSNGHLKVAQWLYQLSVTTNAGTHMIDIHAKNYCNYDAFINACRNGHLEVAQWLYDVSFDSKDTVDIHAEDEYAFRSACSFGHLEVAQWLYHVSFTSKDTIDDLKETYEMDSIIDIHKHVESQDMLHHLCVEQNRSRLNTNRFFRLFIDKL